MDFLHWINPEFLIKTFGLVGVWAIVFAESGLLIGFFLPGDSLLFTAGFLFSRASTTDFILLIVGCFIAAVAGDSVGYAFGRRVGPRMFRRENSLLFHRDHLVRAQRFYDKHGGKTIILARFLPVVRTFAPIVAGIGQMHYRRFLAFNVVGAALWAAGVPTLGFLLGQAIPDIDRYLLPIIVVIILLSVAPTAIHVLRDPHFRRSALAAWRQRRGRSAPAEPESVAVGRPEPTDGTSAGG